jgi:hypothetical protein
LGLLLVLLLAAWPIWGQQDTPAGDERPVLQQILTQTYQTTQVGKGLMGVGSDTAIRRAGVVVVVQRPGLYAALDRIQTASNAINGLNVELYRGNKDYPVPVGERFYVFSITVGQAEVNFGLITARKITTPHGTDRIWSIATFFFPQETLANADKDAVFRGIDAWLVPEGRGAAISLHSPEAAAPPPAQPPRPPATLTPGMTRDQIVAALGPPQREVSFGDKTWLTYPGMLLVLEGGKLASLDQAGAPPAKVVVHSDPPGAEIYLDEQLTGSTPSTLDVPPGNHQVSVRFFGYQDWNRNLRVLSGSEINLEAKLEKK